MPPLLPPLFLKSIILAYATVGIIAALGYIPTIKDLWLHKKPSANTNSYIIWTASSGITVLYSIFILPDLLFQIVSWVNFLACATILILMLVLTHNNNRIINKK